jgi:hypothetical protein
MVGKVAVAVTLAAVAASVPASGSSVEAAAVSRCHTGSLSLFLRAENGGLGHRFYRVVLRNRGNRTCSLRGYPGVSLLNARAHQIGRSATRERMRVRRVTVRTRQSAAAKMSVTALDCHRRSTFLKVYPPGETDALVIRARVPACRASIQPLR